MSGSYTFVSESSHVATMTSSSPISPLEPKVNNEYAPFTENQTIVLKAILDAVFKAVTNENEIQELMNRVPKDAPDWQRSAVHKYITSSYTDFPNSFKELITTYNNQLSPMAVAQIQQGLDILSTRPGTALLSGGKGGWLSGKAVPDLTIEERELMLKEWRMSSLKLKRDLFKALVVVPLASLYNSEPTVLDAIGYPSPDRRKHYKPMKEPDYRFSFINPDDLFGKVANDHSQTDEEAILNGPTYKDGNTQYATLDTDVLIIGSGAGGGVVAKVLSDNGNKCLIVEKGIYAPTGEKSRSQLEGFGELYQYGGFFSSENCSISILAGSVFGGGTAINWSASFRTPHHVRQEWAEKYGLDYFLSDGFADSVDAVCDRMGVSTKHLKHSKANKLFIEGCERLGYHFADIPQNTGGHEHSCGFCSFGCPFGEKQGSVETWLVDAAKNGSEFIKQVHIDRLLFGIDGEDTASSMSAENIDDFTYSKSRTKCLGALGSFPDGRKVILRANNGVVVSGGSINTPSIMMRSKIPNPNIGKNLHLHPVVYVTGYFDETVEAWNGPIMTAVSNAIENKDGTGYGAKLEVCMSFPAGQAGNTELWDNSTAHKAELVRYNNSFSLIVLTRDRDAGEVFIDKEGKPRVNYSVSKYDAESMTMGLIKASEILLAAGAKRITTAQASVDSYVVPNDHKGLVDSRWVEWTNKVKAHGCNPGMAASGSAHQMGTCRMGTSPSNSVVDSRGRVWHTQDLYVADASTFPTASGVNPMVSVMSVSHSIGKFIAEDLATKKTKKEQE